MVGYRVAGKVPALPHFHKLSTGKGEQALTELSTGLSTALSTVVRLTLGFTRGENAYRLIICPVVDGV